MPAPDGRCRQASVRLDPLKLHWLSNAPSPGSSADETFATGREFLPEGSGAWYPRGLAFRPDITKGKRRGPALPAEAR